MIQELALDTALWGLAGLEAVVYRNFLGKTQEASHFSFVEADDVGPERQPRSAAKQKNRDSSCASSSGALLDRDGFSLGGGCIAADDQRQAQEMDSARYFR